jgi:endonuclease/exonuclease/phosphatase (EEP) superfamily protein YafD
LILPLVVLLPFAVLKDRALLLPLALAGLLLVGPVMGFHTGWRSMLSGSGSEGEFTIVTFNARGGNTLVWSPANLLAEWQADVVAFQECGRELAQGLRRIPGWHIDTRSGLCLASRFEILGAREMDREALEFAGGAGRVITYELDLGGGSSFLVTNLHLETPRAGFELIRAGRMRQGIHLVREKSLLRSVELRQARFWTEGFPGPHLVAGDFNTPTESRAYREAWGEWRNAFSTAGFGFGGTRLNGWIRVRIDHILANEHWKVVDAWLEEDVGSDHLPTGARLRLR